MQVIAQNQEGAHFLLQNNPNLYLQGKESKTESLYRIEIISSMKAQGFRISHWSPSALGTIQVFINGIETKNLAIAKTMGRFSLSEKSEKAIKLEISWKEDKGF